jgi:hypothetical protein
MSTGKQWQHGLSTVRDVGASGSRGCSLQETSMPAAQRAAEAKAGRMAVLAEQDQERQQGLLRDAQELTRCLNSGIGLLTQEEVRQIANAVTGTNKEPMEVLRGLNQPATPNFQRRGSRECRASTN